MAFYIFIRKEKEKKKTHKKKKDWQICSDITMNVIKVMVTVFTWSCVVTVML